MANAVEITKIHDGERNAVFSIYLASDGTTGELSNTKLVDVSTLNTNSDGVAVDNVRIDRIQANLEGFAAELEWGNSGTNENILHISDTSEFDFDYERAGGITNPKSSGYDGDITISTNGFSAANDNGYIYLECTKRYG